jgi:pantothenate kinase
MVMKDDDRNEQGVPTADATLTQLVDRARALLGGSNRVILGIAGEPGSGKSTISAAIASALGSDAVVVAMDGFHLANEELDRLGLQSRKGAPDTFDVNGFITLLTRLRLETDRTVYAPVFVRALEEAIAAAVAVHPHTRLVIVEGNYLLLDQGAWQPVDELLDEVWYLSISADVRRARLRLRRMSSGEPQAQADRWVTTVDEVNAGIVASCRGRADLIVKLVDGS